MTFWSLGRLNAKVAKGNVLDIPSIRNLGKPLTFSWCVLLPRQGLNCTELVAVGEYHVNASLTKENEGSVIFYLNHVYNVSEFQQKVKKNIRLFYCTIPLCFALRGKTLFFRLCGWLLGIIIVFLTLTFMSITYHRKPEKSRKTFNYFIAQSYCGGGPPARKPLISKDLPRLFCGENVFVHAVEYCNPRQE